MFPESRNLRMKLPYPSYCLLYSAIAVANFRVKFKDTPLFYGY